LVVSGGKGGVGTTTIAVNLAVALAQQRQRAVLVDADPQGGDAAVLCGVEERYTLADVLHGRRPLRQALQPGPAGLQVLPAAWALGQTADASRAAHQRLIDQLRGLPGEGEVKTEGETDGEAALVVVDAGNGISGPIRQFWEAADLVLLVTTPETAAVMDAYASIKLLASGRASGPDPSIFLRTLVNKAPTRSVARLVHARLAQACLRFLGMEIDRAGHLPHDPRLPAAGAARQPIVIHAPRSRSARRVRGLAKTVLQWTPETAVTT
jgi:flagellar biosynthesis protein FlhG